MNWKVDKVLGYVYCIDKTSPYASSGGKLYQHHYVMCNHIGRNLRENECVHHIDRDKTNNNIENLQLMTINEHAKLHAIEDRGYEEEERTCKNCLSGFVVSKVSNQIFCSDKCSNENSRIFDPSREELKNLVWSMPTTEVAKIFGVSDVAISKRCKLYNIDKPPRGYWAKKRSKIICQ